MSHPRTRDARLSILIYHRVLARPDPLFPEEPDAAAFERKMTWLARLFNVLPLGEAVERLRSGTLPPRAACITFDDGYADNAEVALPILKRLGLRATVFVASGFLDNGGLMFNDVVIEAVRGAAGSVLDLSAIGFGRHDVSSPAARRRAIDALLPQLKYLPQSERSAAARRVAEIAGVALPHDLMMTTAQVRELHASGIEIGGHTVTHPILTRLDAARARAEIGDGRDRLAEIVGAPVDLFAYPNGKPGVDYAPAHVGIVRDLGFRAAVSTAWGAAAADSDVLQLPRFTPWDRSPLRYALRIWRSRRAPAAPALAAV